ncbi:MAG: hypothetical protein FWE68_05650 [Defluviitaleaceae bacterium]|nr:hypothetical protein [Defluviitaleaceae bacterium]
MEMIFGSSGLLWFIWYTIMLIQQILGLGTAYRLTKKGGDNGVALFGWLFVCNLAALVPGLGFYMWHRHRIPKDRIVEYENTSEEEQHEGQRNGF